MHDLLIVTLQLDFKTRMLCSIQKGIVKRQLPFSMVKSCDDGAGSRFTISFKEHHDYELEATSVEDKHKVNLCKVDVKYKPTANSSSALIFFFLIVARVVSVGADHAACESDHLWEHIQ